MTTELPAAFTTRTLSFGGGHYCCFFSDAAVNFERVDDDWQPEETSE